MMLADETVVTGRERAFGPDQPIGALSQFYRAFNDRDMDSMARNWLDSEEASMDNPLGGICRSWANIRPVYERIFTGAARVHVEFHGFTLHHHGEMFYVVGRERGSLQKDGTSLDLRIRTSRLFRFVDGRWRQVHHHGSIDDADLLARYQATLR